MSETEKEPRMNAEHADKASGWSLSDAVVFLGVATALAGVALVHVPGAMILGGLAAAAFGLLADMRVKEMKGQR